MTATMAEATIRSYLATSIHQGDEIEAALATVYPGQQVTVSPRFWPETCIYALAVVEHTPETVLDALSAANTPDPKPQQHQGTQQHWETAWGAAWDQFAQTIREAYQPGHPAPTPSSPPNIENYLTMATA